MRLENPSNSLFCPLEAPAIQSSPITSSRKRQIEVEANQDLQQGPHQQQLRQQPAQLRQLLDQILVWLQTQGNYVFHRRSLELFCFLNVLILLFQLLIVVQFISSYNNCLKAENNWN